MMTRNVSGINQFLRELYGFQEGNFWAPCSQIGVTGPPKVDFGD